MEIEYCFSISKDKITLEPERQIGSFKLVKIEHKHILDILIEREIISLTSEKIGVRLRKTNNENEFTYKRFLGLDNGAMKYDEVTEPVSDLVFNNFLTGKIELFNQTLKNLARKGKLYPLLTIKNSRQVILYKNETSTVEVDIEGLEYLSLSNHHTAQDAILEIEIIQGKNLNEITKLIDYFKTTYSATTTNEGKNTRACRLLGIVTP